MSTSNEKKIEYFKTANPLWFVIIVPLIVYVFV